MLLLALSVFHCTLAQSRPALPPKGFISKNVTVNGTLIHYVMGGKGKPLVLLHGFGQNWYTWNKILPELSRHFTVIAPDLRGIGESGRPKDGYTKVNMAKDIHALVELLGFKKISLVGHDIGMMVAFSYAGNFSGEVEKLALLDTPVPGIEPVYTQAMSFSWWWGFFSWPASAVLTKGQEGVLLSNFWPVVEHVKNSFTLEERQEFIRAYARRDAIACSFKWFAAFPKDAAENIKWTHNKLTLPVLAVSGEFSATFLPEHIKMVAENVKSKVIPDAGHWLMQENSSAVQQTFLDFFK